MPLSYFTEGTVADGEIATSKIDKADLVTAIQNKGTDSYFDTEAELSKVYVYYYHEDGRQNKKIVHETDGSDLVGTVSWTSNARDGFWEKTKIKVFDHDGAVVFLNRSDIGTSEDLSHSDGSTILNTL